MVNPRLNIFHLIIFIGLQIGIFLLKDDPGWNIVMLLGLSIYFGLMSCTHGSNIFYDSRWISYLLFLGVTITSGVFIHRDLKIPRLFFSLIFFLTYLLDLFYGELVPDLGFDILFVSGLVIWGIVLSSTIKRIVSPKTTDNPISLACDLCVILVYVYWMSELTARSI